MDSVSFCPTACSGSNNLWGPSRLGPPAGSRRSSASVGLFLLHLLGESTVGPELLEMLLCQGRAPGHPAWRTHSSQETHLSGHALSLTGPDLSGNCLLEFGVENRKADQSSTCSQWVLYPHPRPFLGLHRRGCCPEGGWAEL